MSHTSYPLACAALMAAAISSFTPFARASGFTLDGIRNATLESGYVERSVQTNTNASNNVLANLHTAVTNANLQVFIGGRIGAGNALLLFIDSKPGGVSFISNNLITTGEEKHAINNLGVSAEDGMRFETGFQPDYAIRIQGSDFNNQAWVHRYDLVAGTGHALGNAANATRSGGFVSGVHVWWQNVNVAYDEVVHGVEMSLNLPLMGATAGTHTIRMMAMIVNADSSFASNQTLASLDEPAEPPRAPIGTAISSYNFETDESSSQTIVFEVTHDVIDSDGDGILDEYETNDGIYISPTATGTDPLKYDTDGDGFSDGDEVSGVALGFVSNPNIPNYVDIWAPANFNGFAVNEATRMERVGNSLEEQYQWRKWYRIQTPVTVNFKLTAGGVPEAVWGPGPAPGTVLPNNSNNFTGRATATGFYEIVFDQAALTWNFSRKVFPTLEDYLDAYGVPAGVDTDGDGLLNEEEYFFNTDPTNPDSDNDGLIDSMDPDPLRAARDITFQVDMSVQEEIEAFDPAVDQVKVQFFGGLAWPGDLALTPAGGGIYTGTLGDVEGLAGDSFGEYKFAIVQVGVETVYFEDQIFNRNFNLGPAHQGQTLPVVFFNDFASSVSGGYESWAEQFDVHPGAPGEDFDGDGFTNFEEYLFGTMPDQPTASLIEMERDGDFFVVRYNEREDGSIWHELQESPDMTAGSWDFADFADIDVAEDQSGLPEGYTRAEARIPMTAGSMFFRVKAWEDDDL